MGDRYIMRIRIGALKSSLSEEISALEVKASDCRVWLEKMGSFDLSVFGLEGEGFRVLSSRVQDQGVYVRGFFLLVDAVRRGDEANRKAVGMLEPSEPDGLVDVDHLTYLAEGWRRSWVIRRGFWRRRRRASMGSGAL